MGSIDNESPPGSWKKEMERMPWKFTQDQKVHWALAELRIRGLWTEATVLANEINILKADLEAVRTTLSQWKAKDGCDK